MSRKQQLTDRLQTRNSECLMHHRLWVQEKKKRKMEDESIWSARAGAYEQAAKDTEEII